MTILFRSGTLGQENLAYYLRAIVTGFEQSQFRQTVDISYQDQMTEPFKSGTLILATLVA
jgi:hypothetical protein